MIYLPKHFENHDELLIQKTTQEYPFATLISQDTEEPFISHLPLIFHSSSKTIIGHMAKKNPHVKHFENQTPVTAVFMGPHAHISSKWYKVYDVPTWNYAVIHMSGTPKLITDYKNIITILTEFMNRFENDSYKAPHDLQTPESINASIVCFEIKVNKILPKFKLSQNRSADDWQGVIDGLSQSPANRQMIELMQTLKEK